MAVTWRRMGVSWKVYVDQLRAADKDAVVVALAVADRALTEAKTTLGKQLEAIIAKIDLLESHAGGAIPRLETESRLEALAERFTAQVAALNTTVQGLHDAVLGAPDGGGGHRRPCGTRLAGGVPVGADPAQMIDLFVPALLVLGALLVFALFLFLTARGKDG